MRTKSWKSLLLKVRHLAVEVEDRRDVLAQYLPEFDRLVRAAAGEVVEPPAQPESNEPGLVPLKKPEEPPKASGTSSEGGSYTEGIPDPSPDDTSYPEAARKLWKAIAAATHPDKTGNDPELTEVYKRASEAWKNRQFEVLLDIAIELDIVISADENLVPYIQQRSETLSNEIQHIDRLAVWHWVNAPEEEKARIVERAAASYIQLRNR